jgi:hypothetical protein
MGTGTGSGWRSSKRLGRILFPLRFLLFAAFYCYLAKNLLWWAYDMSAFIRDGALECDSALWLCREMGLVLTILASLAWFMDVQWGRCSVWRKRAWRVTYRTALAFCFYLVVVMTKRELWHQNQGVNDNAMFFGHLNAQFFAEVGWISFLFVILPLMSAASGMLFLVNLWTEGHD